MALSADTTRTLEGFSSYDAQVATTIQEYSGGYCGIGGPTHATAATRGRTIPWAAATAGLIPFGIGQKNKLGNTSAVPIPTQSVETGPGVLCNVSVTGVSALGDVGKLVYATDDNTFTLTRPTYGVPIGIVISYRTSTYCDVLLLGFVSNSVLQLAGNARDVWHIPVSGVVAGAGNVATGLVMPYHGKFISVNGIVVQALATAGADVSYNLEIGGTNVTGGVVQVVLADAQGAKKTGSAITADNEFHEGDLLDIEVAMASASSAGLVLLDIMVERMLGN
jgi:hypothetical protein